jgi:hypothetical protein
VSVLRVDGKNANVKTKGETSHALEWLKRNFRTMYETMLSAKKEGLDLDKIADELIQEALRKTEKKQMRMTVFWKKTDQRRIAMEKALHWALCGILNCWSWCPTQISITKGTRRYSCERTLPFGHDDGSGINETHRIM